MDSASPSRPRPWATVWNRPRETMRGIVRSPDPEQWVLPLAALGGFVRTLDRADWRNLADGAPLFAIFAFALIGGAIGGVIALYIGGWVFRWTGRWFGGRAPATQVRAAIAWANAPMIVALALWIPKLAIFGKELFTSVTPRVDAAPGLTYALYGFTAIEVAIAIWAIVILVKCLGEAHGFSAWKALASVIAGVLVILVPLTLIVYVAGVVSGGA